MYVNNVRWFTFQALCGTAKVLLLPGCVSYSQRNQTLDFFHLSAAQGHKTLNGPGRSLLDWPELKCNHSSHSARNNEYKRKYLDPIDLYCVNKTFLNFCWSQDLFGCIWNARVKCAFVPQSCSVSPYALHLELCPAQSLCILLLGIRLRRAVSLPLIGTGWRSWPKTRLQSVFKKNWMQVKYQRCPKKWEMKISVCITSKE